MSGIQRFFVSKRVSEPSDKVQPYIKASASGGAESINAGYKTHIFTESGSMTFSSVPRGFAGNVEYFIQAGGGGGGNTMGGGGGAGGYLYGSTSVTENFYQVNVGAAGAGAPNRNVSGSSGTDSSFGNITAIGGGGGGSWEAPGLDGGSGGGSSGNRDQPGSGTINQGNSSINRFNSCGNYQRGTGGGGAGGLPSNNGGAGLSNSLTGTALFYAAGGGGGANGCSSSGGSSIGGNGTGNGSSGSNGIRGSGGGAGGYSADGPGGSGGNGIIVVKYLYA